MGSLILGNYHVYQGATVQGHRGLEHHPAYEAGFLSTVLPTVLKTFAYTPFLLSYHIAPGSKTARPFLSWPERAAE